MTTIATLAMDERSQARFDRLRETHYPAELNRIVAHLTLFHTLPGDAATRDVLARAAKARQAFAMRVSGVMELGRGVAFAVESAELRELHAALAAAFREELSAQDRQGFRPHVVVQNKVSGDAARALKATLAAEFTAWDVQAVGLCWWEYLGGPWRLLERMSFGATPSGVR